MVAIEGVGLAICRIWSRMTWSVPVFTLSFSSTCGNKIKSFINAICYGCANTTYLVHIQYISIFGSFVLIMDNLIIFTSR